MNTVIRTCRNCNEPIPNHVRNRLCVYCSPVPAGAVAALPTTRMQKNANARTGSQIKYAVIVADTNITLPDEQQSYATGEDAEVRGPFDTQAEAEDYAMTIERWLVLVVPVIAPSDVLVS